MNCEAEKDHRGHLVLPSSFPDENTETQTRIITTPRPPQISGREKVRSQRGLHLRDYI